MIRAKRHRAIIEMLNLEPLVVVSELAERFGVAESTVRRDLDELERLGIVRREYGCATLNDNWQVEPSFQERRILHRPEKRLVGQLAAAQVEDGETIFIDGGTTTEFIVQHLATRRELTVVTCGFNIASRLLSYDNIATIVIGGSLDPESQNLVPLHGDEVSQLSGLRLSKAFISAGGVSAEFGVTNRLVNRIPTKQMAMEVASQSLLVVDGSKIGAVTVGFVAQVARFAAIVTEMSAPSSELEALKRLGPQVFVASQENQAARV